MNLLHRLLGRGCAHQFLWPRSGADGRYYQRCSRCGIAYEYDWETMRRTNRLMATAVPAVPDPAPIGRNHIGGWPADR